MNLNSQLHAGAYADTRAGYIAGPADPVAEAGPFTMAGMAFEDVHSLVRRVQSLAERLCGPIPQQGSEATKGLDHKPPMFAALRIEADRAASSVRAAHEALDRIENQLS